MLYIFHVDTGATLTFDIKLALQSVAELKEAIERECGVLAAHQVLLMSGGESLEPHARVCSYSAGTDTNPIYLFSKAAIESQIPPIPHTDYSTDVDLVDQINASLAMPATYSTLVSRAQLAQQCYVIARDQTRTCEHLVHDQHLQQQGWAAVVANLEDITQMFQSKADLLQQSFAQYLTEREQHMQLLNTFNSDLENLSKIPILPALRAQAEGLLSPEDQTSESECSDEVMSLLRWISAKDNQSSLEQVAEQCSRGLEQFDERMMEALKNEVNAAIDASNKPEMKEIKGLGERLFALEQLMAQTKRLVQEQGELAQGFHQNQTRANNLGDASVLPDLCASHRRQLAVMMENHSQLRDIRRRCTRAKEELSENIYHRLKWIMYVENKMMEVDGKLVMYHENLKRLRRHLEVLQQIHLAPQMYISAVAEVVRRRTFSQAFLVWASNLACQLLTVYNEEIAKRREFQNKFDGHFLNTLFPGLEDIPPPFATQAPTVFDGELPKLTAEDMESLKVQLPDLADSISTLDLSSITQFFLSKSLTEGSTDDNKNKESSTMMPVDVSTKEQSDQVAMTSDRIGFESETDTDEFEKISQGVSDSKHNLFEQRQKTKKQLEENLGNTRNEVERLRNIIRALKVAMNEAVSAFRQELSLLRERVNDDKGSIINMSERICQVTVLHSQECERILREREQELTVDHELELADAKKLIRSKDDEILNLKQTILEKDSEGEQERMMSTRLMRQKWENDQEELRNMQTKFQSELEKALDQARIDKENAVKQARDAGLAEINALNNTLEQYKVNIQELEETLATTRAEQQKLVKEATDKLQMEFKTELETIRSRFKLMAASSVMERSPSDSSLEKIERPDVIELASHEAILAQTKKNMEAEKAEAIRKAIEKETEKFEMKLQYGLSLATKQMDAQLESQRLRESSLVEECRQYQDMIRRVTDDECRTRQQLSEKLEKVEEEKRRLELLMIAERKQRDTQIHDLEAEKSKLRQELNDERMKMSQSGGSGTLVDTLKMLLSGGKDDIEVSESKKVRLESAGDAESLLRRLEMLEGDNNRLSTELRLIRENKETIEARVEALEADKVRLEIELVKERSRRGFGASESGIAVSIESRDKDMNASVALVSDSNQEAGNPEHSRQDSVRYREKLMKSTNSMFQQLSVSLYSCNPGDSVIVLWDTVHSSYIILQESRTMYFLHSDCIDSLDLRLGSDGLPKQIYVFGEVVDKQYCHAKRSENRYHVPQGTKFYRVRVKPAQRDLDLIASTSDKSLQ
ncbi:RB1-inducible coiled-coil protein 1 [Chelonus insularis]|uniref:RB1-inducible coiled-coil protein 1 n=1 Tax=Chelonus insularis TaxID=460826 RepID=UPI0015899A6F|nr:RB1-inducible coiled-coil protein 1 [Chelonus insularis]